MKMKYISLQIASLSLAAFVLGCKPSVKESSVDDREGTARQFDKVKAATTEAAQAMKDYAYAQKAEFVATMEKQLAELNRNLDELAAKIEKGGDAAKAEARPKLESLREQAASLSKKLEEARNATEPAWDAVKVTFKKGYDDLKDEFNKARQWVSEKIAP